MSIALGDPIPSVTLINRIGESLSDVDLAARVAGKTVILFGLPGAYPKTCTEAHLPSYICNMDAFRSKGVGEVLYGAVKDIFVVQHWAAPTSAEASARY